MRVMAMKEYSILPRYPELELAIRCSLVTYHRHSLLFKIINIMVGIKVYSLVIVLIITSNNRLIGLVGRMFANGLGDPSSIPGQVIPKTSKMVLDTYLLNT